MSIQKATSTNGGTTEEGYEFTALPSAGKINVANLAHDSENAKEHTYTVSMAAGDSVSCTCPSDKYHEGACKHRKAVEARNDFEREDDCNVCGGTGVSPSGADCFACVISGGSQ